MIEGRKLFTWRENNFVDKNPERMVLFHVNRLVHGDCMEGSDNHDDC